MSYVVLVVFITIAFVCYQGPSIKCPASWRWRSCLSKRRGLELPTSYPSLLQYPTRTSGCPAFFSFCLRLLLFLSSLPVVRKCSKPSLLITWPKNVACCFLIFCTNDLLVFASFDTISFVFFAVHGMCNILL